MATARQARPAVPSNELSSLFPSPTPLALETPRCASNPVCLGAIRGASISRRRPRGGPNTSARGPPRHDEQVEPARPSTGGRCGNMSDSPLPRRPDQASRLLGRGDPVECPTGSAWTRTSPGARCASALLGHGYAVLPHQRTRGAPPPAASCICAASAGRLGHLHIATTPRPS